MNKSLKDILQPQDIGFIDNIEYLKQASSTRPKTNHRSLLSLGEPMHQPENHEQNRSTLSRGTNSRTIYRVIGNPIIIKTPQNEDRQRMFQMQDSLDINRNKINFVTQEKAAEHFDQRHLQLQKSQSVISFPNQSQYSLVSKDEGDANLRNNYSVKNDLSRSQTTIGGKRTQQQFIMCQSQTLFNRDFTLEDQLTSNYPLNYTNKSQIMNEEESAIKKFISTDDNHQKVNDILKKTNFRTEMDNQQSPKVQMNTVSHRAGTYKEDDHSEKTLTKNSSSASYSMFSQKSPCFSENPDPMMFEYMTAEDWLEILPESLFKDKNIDVHQLIEENSEYFLHIAGLCACARCKCGTCQCDLIKSKFRLSNMRTSYSKDFLQFKSTYPLTPLLTDKMLETRFLGLKSIDLNSNNRQDYVEHQLNPIRVGQPQETINSSPFNSTTSYNTNFINWNSYQNNKIAGPNLRHSHQDMKFFGETSYKHAFANEKQINPPESFASNMKNSQAFAPIAPFLGETTNMGNLKPFKTQIRKPQEQNHNYQNTPSYDGQFKTISRDYQGKVEIGCDVPQIQKMWRQQILDHFDYLKTKNSFLKQEDLEKLAHNQQNQKEKRV